MRRAVTSPLHIILNYYELYIRVSGLQIYDFWDQRDAVSRKIIAGAKNAPEEQRTFCETTIVFILGIFYIEEGIFLVGTNFPRTALIWNRTVYRYTGAVSEQPIPSSEVIEMQLKISTAIGPEFIHVLSGPRSE
ncbi:hypothetical protein QTP88_017113 [Uroleucon formosanum]